MSDTSTPAFARSGYWSDGGEVAPQRGMTLRQYYAGQALISIIADAHVGSRPHEVAKDVAKAVEYADALIAELAK